MADWIWDLEPCEGDEDFDYTPYFQKLTELDFASADDYQRDLDDEKWLELDG
ncbi:hypothetical protein LOC68_09950 [Blastopirellula sp. JC732]|uniref:Uncharacterized protein n=1 Tax=Blastopirellula sediminis TaxID=2894196 RepID=A0A9X1SGI2_9BACT|nr:hypothetical protein [Blastopirellula sediminis]MCC9608502.1 hypothetical protein [Blastopirellula sediminis]MCC9628721.1 hypothetical protein [Blastopirellula sediminis]